MRKNQIRLLQEFIHSEQKSLVINCINEAIDFFYISVIKFFTNKIKLKVILNLSEVTNQNMNDLFGGITLSIYFNTNSRKVYEILKNEEKKIIFTDYKNYKKINSQIYRINSYQHDQDIEFFIKEIMNIDNDELIFYCKSNPALIFSEISKYMVNNKNYIKDQKLNDDINHIMEIRKSIFENKKNNFNIKNLYLNIKKEAEYKKLSFLTY